MTLHTQKSLTENVLVGHHAEFVVFLAVEFVFLDFIWRKIHPRPALIEIWRWIQEHFRTDANILQEKKRDFYHPKLWKSFQGLEQFSELKLNIFSVIRNLKEMEDKYP